MKRVVVLSDMQIPLHDARAITAVEQFVKDFKPDELYCVGDEADQFEISRWDKGTALEYAGTYQRNLDRTSEIMGRFKDAIGDKPFHVMRSNHGETRVKSYLKKWAPALDSLRELKYERLLGYDQMDITYHNKLWSFAPGWVLAHGDEGNAVQTPGGTAMALAKRVGLSVVSGHTHKAGIQHFHAGYGGKITRPLYGVEVGHLMDMSKASYLPSGFGNWQQAFAILYIRAGNVTPVIVPINGRSFTVEGKLYKW
jgi:predicted phosphodiesterase